MNKDIKMEKQAQRPYCLLNFNQAEPAYEKQIKSTTMLYQHLDELFHEPELASQAEFAKEVAECREDDKRVIWNAGCTYACRWLCWERMNFSSVSLPNPN